MKILDIITPHETLTEADNFLTRWFARSLGRFAGTTAEKRVSSWVDSAIRELEAQSPGHEIKRTEELKRAESALISVMEKNPYPDELTKIDSLATSLSEYLIATGKSSVGGKNAVETLATLVRQGSIKHPSIYGSDKEFLSDPFIVSEIQGLVTAAGTRIELAGSKYIRELAEAKTQVYKEIKNIQPVKTKEQKKKEENESETEKLERENKLKDARNKSGRLDLEAKALEEELAANRLSLDAFFKRQDKLFKYFAGSEVARTYLQFQQQVNNIQKWQYGYKDGTPIPAEIARFFPDLPKTGLQPSDPSVEAKVKRPGDGKPYFYRTSKQRYDCASNYAFLTVLLLWVKQLAVGSLSWFAPSLTAKSVSYVGGKIPIIGKAKIVHNIIELFNNALASSPAIVKTLGSISWVSKVFFVDFMMTNVVAKQDASENLAYWLNTALQKSTGAPAGATMDATNAINWSDFTPEEIDNARKGLSMLPDYSQAPELGKAWASVVLQGPIDSMKEGSYARTFMEDAVATYLIPYKVAEQIIIQGGMLFATATSWIWPLIGKMVGGTEAEAPVGDDETHRAPSPATPASSASDPKAGKEQGELANVTPPDAPASAPVQDRQSQTGQVPPKVNTTTSNLELEPFTLKRESVRESLKRRVEKLMRS